MARWIGLALSLTLVTASPARVARATIVDRVVAVVGDKSILWTDLMRRGAASRLQIRAQTRDSNVVALQEQEMYRELVDRMIDDRLEQDQADKAHIAVTQEEIDRGLENIAAQARLQQNRPVSVGEVIDEARRRGIAEQEFREEIRRQLLEGKLIELRVRPRVNVTVQDARAAYERAVEERKRRDVVELRVLALRIPARASTAQTKARSDRAAELAQQARSGTDFCWLVANYSDDFSTRSTCGSRGPQASADLWPSLREAVQTLGEGDVSDPVAIHTATDDGFVIVTLAPAPAFETVKVEMEERAWDEALSRARKDWLLALRHNVYIDVRL